MTTKTRSFAKAAIYRFDARPTHGTAWTSYTCVLSHQSRTLKTPARSTTKSVTKRAPVKVTKPIVKPTYKPVNKPSVPTLSRPAPTSLTKTSNADDINGPPSTLPPPITYPSKSEYSTPVYYKPVYYLQLGRTYSKFYWAAVKQTWHNHKEARALLKEPYVALSDEEREMTAGLKTPYAQCTMALINAHFSTDVKSGKVADTGVTRRELQLLFRDRHDIGKLPFFGALAIVCGEWLPLLVPFMPSVAPLTCRLPEQIESMRKTAQERRKASFRAGVEEPGSEVSERIEREVEEQIGLHDAEDGEKIRLSARDRAEIVPVLSATGANPTEGWTKEQLLHVGSSLGLFRKLWDHVGGPPEFLLHSTIKYRLLYLALDDALLIKTRGVGLLNPEELTIACEERGIDVVGVPQSILKSTLEKWLEGRQKDNGTGRVLFKMLFRR